MPLITTKRRYTKNTNTLLPESENTLLECSTNAAVYQLFWWIRPGMGDTIFWTGRYDTDKSCASIFSPIRYRYNTWDQFSTGTILIRYLRTIFNLIWYRYDTWDQFPTWYLYRYDNWDQFSIQYWYDNWDQLIT